MFGVRISFSIYFFASRFYYNWYILSIKICVFVYLLLRLKGFLSKVRKVAKFKGQMQKSLKSCLPTTLYFSWRTHIASTILPLNQRCYVGETFSRMPLLDIVCFFVCMAFPNIKGSCRATEGKKEWHGHAVLIEIIHVGMEFNVIRILTWRFCGRFVV